MTYYQKNRERIKQYARESYLKNKIKRIKQMKKYRLKNIDRIKIKEKIYRIKNKVYYDFYIKLYYKKYYRTHRKEHNLYLQNKRKINITFKILENLRRRLNSAIKNNSKSKHTLELLGCSIQQLKDHLQKQFTKGMSFSNYGKWHIDHIKPCVLFDLSKPSEQKKCFNYKNLQPLWAIDNWIKKDKVISMAK